IALAVHNYSDVHQQHLPPLTDVGPNAPTGAGLRSLFFNLLPYLEEDAVFRRFDPARPVTYAGARDGVARTIFRTFLNPADGTANEGATTDLVVALPFTPPAPFAEQFVGHYATTSFAANGLVFGTNDGRLPDSFVDG